ncbi:MAG: hypothetical protein KatS3mg028_0997 [Bacteroidia bacterium]|nr:MAG: hypothetical protein KatS3mg028_0997 [Bacteroidia bacterium]
MKKQIITTAIIPLLWGWVFKAQNEQAQTMLNRSDRCFFIENKGQWHSDVFYLCRMGGLDAWITRYGVNYTFYKFEKDPMPPPKQKTNAYHGANLTVKSMRTAFYWVTAY